MSKNKAVQLAAGIVSTAVFLSLSTICAKADSIIASEQGIAGISAILENTTEEELEDAYNTSMQMIEEEKAKNSPYANLGVSIAKENSFVNIRKSPSTEDEIVGRLYRGCAADILERLEGDWVKIKSGSVEGYIASNYLAIGEQAETMVDKYATKLATVNTETLRVREERNTDSKILTLVPYLQSYVVINEYDEWVEILLGSDNDTGSDFTGFVNKQYVDITVEFKYAMSMEEIKRQEEAVRAEKERKERLVQEEAERKEAQRKEAERKAEQAAREQNKKDKDDKNDKNDKATDDNSSGNTSSNSSGSSNSSLRSDLISYALKFVGNPYVWGGTSLTRGADCSGFTQAIYAGFGYKIPRTSREQAKGAGVKVSESDLRQGDLIFYANSRGTVNHVAIYIGNGKIVHAANSRQGIITSQYKYRDIHCVRRVLN